MSPRRASAGFTLIEMLITVVLSTLVGVLVYNVFISQTQAYRAQADMGNMQQNLRVAMEMLSRDIASAGFGTGHDGGIWGAGGQATAAEAVFALHVIENYNGSGTDAVEIAMLDPDRNNWATTDMNTRHECGTSTMTFHPEYAAQSTLYDPTGTNAQIGCFAPSVRGRPVSFVWDVTGVGAGGTVPIATNTQTDFTAQCENNLPLMMVCAPVKYVAYYVDNSSIDGIGMGSPTLPVLYFVPDIFAADLLGGYPTASDIPVALGIEDLQLQTCQAGSGLDCNLVTSWNYGYDLSQTTTTWENLAAVRIMLTARTVRPDQNRASVSTPIDLDAADTIIPTATPDGYHRRVARTEVTMRNAIGTWQVTHQSW